MASSWGFIVLKRLILDICIPLFDTGSDIYNAYLYFYFGNIYWGAFTVSFVFLPGIMEMIYWMSMILCYGTKFKDFCYWICFFGPFSFPFYTPIWHFKKLFNGRVYHNSKYSKSMVLKSLEAFTESAPQLLLQSTIIIITWSTFSNHIWQIISISFSSVFLTLTSIEHYIHEISGKEDVPRIRDLASNFVFFYLNIVTRTFVLSVLIAYYRWWITVFIAGLIILNFIGATIIFDTHFGKRIWTSVSSVLTLSCFVAKDDVSDLKIRQGGLPSKLFHRFLVFNSFSFAFVCGIGSLVLRFILPRNDQTFFTYSCEQLPAFSCSLSEDCPSRACNDSNEPHSILLNYMLPIFWALMVAQIIFVGLMKYLVPSLLKVFPTQRYE